MLAVGATLGVGRSVLLTGRQQASVPRRYTAGAR
jgi:hypothetical protein